MKILYSPQVNTNKIEYKFDGDIITATYKEITDTFDFTGFTDGELQVRDFNGKPMIETTLEIIPIVSAKRIDGILNIELLNFIDNDATDEEKFPNWVEV